MNIKAFFGKLIYVLPLVLLAANCNSQKQAGKTEENKTENTTPSANNGLQAEGYKLSVPEISQKSPSGETLTLSSLQGNLVLVDFWASWCPPCRMANPELVALYKKYNGKAFNNAKGFEIFSVSLDNDANKWQQAILKDGLIWKYHVSDLRGWQSAAARDYGVNSIPASLLLDEKGAIVGTNMSPAAMEQYLDSRLK